MTKHQNMKIEINAEQPLDEVVMELRRIGCEPLNITAISPVHKWIVSDSSGIIVGWFNASILGDHYPTTTLQQLREMK